MAVKKRNVTQEPLLNTVARKLGHAAGTLSKVTHELTENLSGLPENLATKVRDAGHISAPQERSRIPAQHPKRTIRRASQEPGTKRKVGVARRKSRSKSSRKPASAKN
jgi:hypothetical protein